MIKNCLWNAQENHRSTGSDDGSSDVSLNLTRTPLTNSPTPTGTPKTLPTTTPPVDHYFPAPHPKLTFTTQTSNATHTTTKLYDTENLIFRQSINVPFHEFIAKTNMNISTTPKRKDDISHTPEPQAEEEHDTEITVIVTPPTTSLKSILKQNNQTPPVDSQETPSHLQRNTGCYDVVPL